MTRSNLNELLAVLEDIRARKYPEIPPEVIEKIVITQYENQDDRVLARSKTVQAIADFLHSVSIERGQ